MKYKLGFCLFYGSSFQGREYERFYYTNYILKSFEYESINHQSCHYKSSMLYSASMYMVKQFYSGDEKFETGKIYNYNNCVDDKFIIINTVRAYYKNAVEIEKLFKLVLKPK